MKDFVEKAANIKNAAALSILIVAGGASTGCETMQEYGQKGVDWAKENDKTLLGAGGGALLGAIVSDKDRGRGAIIGAAIGGAGGAYWDKMERDLRKKLESSGVTVTRTPEGIKLDVQNNVTFTKNSSEVNPSFYNSLNGLAGVLDSYDKTTVTIHGFTDSSGDASFNQRLSTERAQKVEAYLEGQGVDPSRVSSVGHGEKYADQSKVNPADRHVEFDIHSMQ